MESRDPRPPTLRADPSTDDDAPPPAAPIVETRPTHSPAPVSRLATVMVFNLLVPTAVLALFKGFQDYQTVYDQTYGRLERWTSTLANLWEPTVAELAAARADPRKLREPAARLRRTAHRLLLENRREVDGVLHAALLDSQGKAIASVGPRVDGIPAEALEEGMRRLKSDEGEGSVSIRLTGQRERLIVLRAMPGADGPVLMSIFDSDPVRARLRKRMMWLAALDTGLALLVGVLAYLLIYRFVIRPVQELQHGARQIAMGRLDHRLPADSPDELGMLAAEFNLMAARLSDGYRELQTHNHRLKADREYAARLQRRLLPSRLPDTDRYHFSVEYEPCEDLGGDFYDVFALDPTHVAIYIADVAGHGIGAALITVFIRQTIARLREQTDRMFEPERVLAALRDRFAEEDFGTLFVSMIYGVLDTEAGVFRFASAGHPVPLICADSLVNQGDDDRTGPVLSGMLPDMEFPEQTLEIPPGSRLLLYTDGAVDAMGPDQRSFGLSRLRRLLAEQTRLGCREWTRRAASAIREHCGNRPLVDDVTLVAVSASAVGRIDPEVFAELAGTAVGGA